MPDPNETGQKGGQDVREQAQAEIKMEIEGAEKSSNPDQAKEELGKRLARQLKDVSEDAKEVVANEEKAKKGEEVFGKENEKKDVAAKVIKVLEAAKKGITVARTKEGQVFLEKIAAEIPSPSLSQCNQLASYLTPYLLGEKDIVINPPDQGESEFQRDFKALAEVNPELANRIGQILLEMVEQSEISNISKEMINYLLREVSIDKSKKIIPNELLYFYSQSDPEVFRLLVAIQSKESFIEYLEELKKMIENEDKEIGNNGKDIEIRKKISKYLEELFIDLIDQLYYKFDLNPSYINEEFGRVESKGYTRSVEMVSVMLINQLERLIKDLSGESNFKDRFYVRYTVTEERIEKKSPETREEVIRYLTVQPHGKEVDLANFLRFVLNEMGHVREIREFNHNSRLLFRLGGAGKEGFWNQMANYASRMKSTDFDSIAYLPHNDIFRDALMIYNHFLQAELAKNDWILDPKMFAPKESGFTEIEEMTLRVLEHKYKDKKTDLQIRAAFNRALGVSWAVLLTEVETIADADPNLKVSSGKVEPTYVGEWLSDTVATTAFNPFTKGILRWMAEGVTGGPMAYLQIPDPRKKRGIQIGIWDHKSAFEQIKYFHKLFIEGGRTRAEKGYKTLLDIRNPGRIGSIITRGGWREFYSYDSYLGLIEGKDGRKYYDFYKAWRRIENIGFECLVDFVNNRMGDFINGRANEGHRVELIKYLLASYFPDLCNEDQLGKINSEKDFFKLWKEKYPDKKSDEEIRKEFLFQALARVLFYRLPSKLITHDRTRWSETGERMWERLRRSVFGTDENSFRLIDQAVKDLILAQAALREKLSSELGKIQQANGDIGETRITYVLTEDRIREFLEEIKVDDERIKNAIKVFKKLREFYLYENGGKTIFDLSKKLQKYRDNFPFALAAEEIDYRFIVLRGTGQTTIKRALDDITRVEQNVAGAYFELISLLGRVAISGKKDIGEIVSLLSKVKKTLTGMHGKQYANEVVYYFAYLTIQYFKKDTFAKPLGGLAGFGTVNSIAGEFAGGSTRVWEWDSRDIGRFIYALEVAGVLEKSPYDLSKAPDYEPLHFSIFGREIKLPNEINISMWLGNLLNRKTEDGNVIPIKFFGKEIKIIMPKVYKKDFEIYSKTLMQLAGGAWIHKLYDAFNTVIPIGLALLLFLLIYQAIKENFSGKK